MKKEKVSRRNYAKVAGAGVVGIAIGAAGGYYGAPKAPSETITKTETATVTEGVSPTTQPTEQYPIPEIPYMPKKGTTIRVLVADEPSCMVREILNDEFERLTGIKPVLEIYPWDTVYEKGILEMTTGGDYYDVIDCDGTLIAPFASMKPGWHYLGDFEEENNLPTCRDTMPTRLQKHMCEDPTTFDPKAAGPGTGKYVCISPNYNNIIMAYRADLFDNAEEKAAFKSKYGYDLVPPETHKQFFDATKFFARKAGDKLAGETLDHDFYGTDFAVGGGMAFEQWLYRYVGLGYPDDTCMGMWKPFSPPKENVVDIDKAEKAFQIMVDLFNSDAISTGALKKSYSEPAEDIISGITAMTCNWGNPMAHLIDPARNPYANSMGFKGFPVWEGINERHMWGLGWGTSITQASKNKMEAFMWIYWVSRVEQGWKLLESGKGWMPVIEEQMTTQRAIDMNPMIKPTHQTMLDGDMPPPPLAEIFEIWDGCAVSVTKAMTGEFTPRQAAEDVKSVLNDILTTGGYI